MFMKFVKFDKGNHKEWSIGMINGVRIILYVDFNFSKDINLW